MKKKLMAMMLLAAGAMFAETRFSIGVNLGGYPPPPPPVAVAPNYQPPCPGPGYVWVDGYYDAYGAWVNGYWTLPPYEGAYWTAPRVYGRRFIAGFWSGPRYAPAPRFDYRGHESARYEHSFRDHDRGRDWDHDRGRDWDHDRGRDWDHGRGRR